MSKTLSYDSTASFKFGATEGVTVDDGEATFDWDDIEVVTVNDAPWTDAFDTDKFYKLKGVLTKPVEQRYRREDGVETYTKPSDEIRNAAWSADNIPFTLGHPSTGVVRSRTQVHGFWRNPEFDADTDELNETLFLPVNDTEAMEFVEDANDVSIGFYHDLSTTYDGFVGDVEEDNLDGYQTNLLIDHAAAVDEGRCPGSEGCGLMTDDSGGETFRKIYGAEYGVDVDTGMALDAARQTELQNDVGGSEETTESGTDDTTENNSTMELDIDESDLTIDALAEKNDEVAELVSDKQDLEDERDNLQPRATGFDELREELDIDEDTDTGAVVDTVTNALDEKESMSEELTEYRSGDREEAIDRIEAVTDRYEDDYEDMELDELEDKAEELEGLAEDMGTSIKGSAVDEAGETEDGEEGTLVTGVKAWEDDGAEYA